MPDIPKVFADLLTVPALDGAACTGHGDLFDESLPHEPTDETTARHYEAATLCRTCPVFTSCAELATNLEPRDRSGIYAGVLYRHGRRSSTTILFPRKDTAA